MIRSLILCAAFTVGLGAQPFDGSWNGTLNAGVARLRIGLNITGQEGKWSATLDSPDQGAYGIKVDSVTVDAEKLVFKIAPLMASYEGALRGDRIEGTFTQGGRSFPLVFERGKPKAASRPQHPVAPFPYQSEEVTVPSGDLRLAGTFTYPKQGGPFASVLLVTGSGPQDRDETLFEHKPFLVISDFLTKAGYAVLRLDDRGTGKSTGNFRSAGLKEFTDDALAAVAWLKERPEVNPKRVGILGHSEGGAVGPLAALRSADVAYVVMLAGPAQPFEELLLEQSAGLMRVAGAPESAIEANAQISREAFAILRREPDDAKARAELEKAAEKWKSSEPRITREFESGIPRFVMPEFRSLLAYSGAGTLAKVRCPVLALFGGKDLQVPADSNARAAAQAFASGHVASFSVVKLPGLNHLFQTARTGGVAEYGSNEETISPRALETILNWLRLNVP